MQAAYNPDAPLVDQSIGAHSSHTASGSRFNDLNSRTSPPSGPGVTEAVAQFKAGAFTHEDLKQLAFAMGWQLIEGKDVHALAAKIADLEMQIGGLTARAVNAENAFAALTSPKGKSKSDRKE